jgi:hypothetical protein
VCAACLATLTTVVSGAAGRGAQNGWGGRGSFVELPIVAARPPLAVPLAVAADPVVAGAEWLTSQPLTSPHILRDDPDGITRVEEREGSSQRIGRTTYRYLNVVRRWVDNRDPAHAGFTGRGLEVIKLPGRTRTIRGVVRVVSDDEYSRVYITRSISENGRLVRARGKSIPRDFQ